MIIYEKSDLIKMAEAGSFDVIVHGCNCFNTMGSGIARQIRERYPQAYEVDQQTIKGDYAKLGNYTFCYANKNPNFAIINAYTQYDFNRAGDNDDVFDYLSFEVILQKLEMTFGWARFGFPYIGMGLAGGDKKRIISMLEKFSDKVNTTGGTVTLVEFSA